MTQGKFDGLAKAGEQLITAKTNEIWMDIAIKMALLLMLVWSSVAMFKAVKELYRVIGGM